MADSKVTITEGTGSNIDTRTEATNGQHRQVIVVGHPSVNDAVAEVASLDVGASSTAYGQVVRLAGSAQVNIVAVGTGVTLGVNLGKVDGTIQVNVGKIDDNVSVKFANIAGTAGVNLGKVDGTIQVNVGKVDDLVAIRTTSASGTLGVHLLTTAGTLTVKIGPESAAFINAGHTASIFTVSGSTSGISASGVTLVSPSANASFKVFMYSIQTTAVGSAVFTFTNGAGTSPTEFWRPLVTAAASSSSPIGANVGVTPPGFIFATGVSTTLALLNPSGVLVHYSVSYIKESA